MQHIEKLEKIVEEGNFYGAQQMYKSISARYFAFWIILLTVILSFFFFFSF